jgi:hypothetical protein
MTRLAMLLALFWAMAPHQALAGHCANGVNYAGCAGAGGAAVYNKNTGVVRGGTYGSHYPPQEDWHRLYTIPGCAWVDGRRVCR